MAPAIGQNGGHGVEILKNRSCLGALLGWQVACLHLLLVCPDEFTRDWIHLPALLVYKLRHVQP